MTFNTGTGFTDILTDSGTAFIDAAKPNLDIVGDGVTETSASGNIITINTPRFLIISSQASSYGSTTATIPYDNTVPQNTEGMEQFSVGFTVNNTLDVIYVHGGFTVGHSSAGGIVILTYFIDSEPDARAVVAVEVPSSTGTVGTPMGTPLLGLSATSHTLRMRWGTTSGTAYLGRPGSGQVFNGAPKNYTYIFNQRF